MEGFACARPDAVRVRKSTPDSAGDMLLDTAPASAITVGILAGGRATRLDGRDKAWLARDGVPQVLRIARRFPEVARVLVSANLGAATYARHGLDAVADDVAGAGPIGGLDALSRACRTDWLLTLPVDLVGFNECLLASLQSGARNDGAWAEDDDGAQPLVALWRVAALREAAPLALGTGDRSVHGLQARLDMAPVRFAGVRFGNLNTVDDLRAAGFEA